MTSPNNGYDYRVERNPRREGRGWLIVKCTNGTEGECRFGLQREAASGVTWHWDDNVEKPTITPSIACQKCGMHIVVTKGVVAP